MGRVTVGSSRQPHAELAGLSSSIHFETQGMGNPFAHFVSSSSAWGSAHGRTLQVAVVVVPFATVVVVVLVFLVVFVVVIIVVVVVILEVVFNMIVCICS